MLISAFCILTTSSDSYSKTKTSDFRLYIRLFNENLVYWNSVPITTIGAFHS